MIGVHELRSEFTAPFIASRVVSCPTAFAVRRTPGSDRALPPKPSHSEPTVGALTRSFPVAASL